MSASKWKPVTGSSSELSLQLLSIIQTDLQIDLQTHKDRNNPVIGKSLIELSAI